MERDEFERLCNKLAEGLEKSFAKYDLERETAYQEMIKEGNLSIENRFNLKYLHYGIKLPEDAAERGKGIIEKGPVLIYYAYGKDDDGKHLNVYSTNRFCWGANHIRICENGEEIHLPSEQEIILLSTDCTQEEEDRKYAEMLDHDKKVMELLEKEGIKELMDVQFVSFMDSMKHIKRIQ